MKEGASFGGIVSSTYEYTRWCTACGEPVQFRQGIPIMYHDCKTDGATWSDVPVNMSAKYAARQQYIRLLDADLRTALIRINELENILRTIGASVDSADVGH